MTDAVSVRVSDGAMQVVYAYPDLSDHKDPVVTFVGMPANGTAAMAKFIRLCARAAEELPYELRSAVNTARNAAYHPLDRHRDSLVAPNGFKEGWLLRPGQKASVVGTPRLQWKGLLEDRSDSTGWELRVEGHREPLGFARWDDVAAQDELIKMLDPESSLVYLGITDEEAARNVRAGAHIHKAIADNDLLPMSMKRLKDATRGRVRNRSLVAGVVSIPNGNGRMRQAAIVVKWNGNAPDSNEHVRAELEPVLAGTDMRLYTLTDGERTTLAVARCSEPVWNLLTEEYTKSFRWVKMRALA